LLIQTIIRQFILIHIRKELFGGSGNPQASTFSSTYLCFFLSNHLLLCFLINKWGDCINLHDFIAYVVDWYRTKAHPLAELSCWWMHFEDKKEYGIFQDVWDGTFQLGIHMVAMRNLGPTSMGLVMTSWNCPLSMDLDSFRSILNRRISR
jgi:hypothetical protein